jgi:hypothetical protein
LQKGQSTETTSEATGAQCANEWRYKSLKGEKATQFTIVNQYISPIRLYWLDHAGEREFYGTVNEGAAHTQPTYVSHPWVIADLTDKCIDIYMPEEQQTMFTIR